MATTYDNLEDLLRENPPANVFKPYCYRTEEADALTVRFSQDPDYSERLNDHVTVFRSLATQEFTGCRIKGISELIEDLPNYIHVASGDGISMSLMFLPFRGAADERTRKVINSLARASEGLRLPCESA